MSTSIPQFNDDAAAISIHRKRNVRASRSAPPEIPPPGSRRADRMGSIDTSPIPSRGKNRPSRRRGLAGCCGWIFYMSIFGAIFVIGCIFGLSRCYEVSCQHHELDRRCIIYFGQDERTERHKLCTCIDAVVLPVAGRLINVKRLANHPPINGEELKSESRFARLSAAAGTQSAKALDQLPTLMALPTSPGNRSSRLATVNELATPHIMHRISESGREPQNQTRDMIVLSTFGDGKGSCWQFNGTSGTFVVEMIPPGSVKGMFIDKPIFYGLRIDERTFPKEINVWGMFVEQTEVEKYKKMVPIEWFHEIGGVHLFRIISAAYSPFVYENSFDVDPRVSALKMKFSALVFEVVSNWGDSALTSFCSMGVYWDRGILGERKVTLTLQ